MLDNILIKMNPILIKGNFHQDNRGTLQYNNNFDASQIKRVYIIENADLEVQRGWQGHQIEQRWFSAVLGKFKISLIKIDNWENPSFELKPSTFELSSNVLDVLYVPAGYISCIQAIEDNAKLLVMANYKLGEIKDEYRFDLQQFECTKK
jgi:dTDP-4-dehydrorhamnose 3,5-epimerase-like enzyme